MANENIQQLPAYPSTQIRKALSPTQLATINQTISSSLLQTLALPPPKRDTPAARTFIESFAKDTALQVLQGLIWEPAKLSREDKIIRKRSLLLAQKLATLPSGLEIQNLLDLSIIYAPTNISRIRSVFEVAVKSDQTLIRSVETNLVPAFTQLFTPNQGLYAIRKASHCIVSFLHASPPEIVRCFAHNKSFILALASLYDQGLASIAHSYGGLSVLRNTETVDEWEPIWVQTKVSLIDAFHLIVTSLLNDISSASGRSLATESERTFDVIFDLISLPPSPSNSTSTPYLDRSLLADYQESYALSQILATALRHAAEKDARLDVLESTLQSLNRSSSPGSSANSKDAGVLRILLGSSGIPPGIDNLGNRSRVRSTANTNTAGKGKGKATTPAPASDYDQPSSIPDIDVKITQVLDILPEHPPRYIRALLEYSPFDGDPEKVIGALLEGTAPSVEELDPHPAHRGNVDDVRAYVQERRNVFDDNEMDLTQVRVGKMKMEDNVLQDRSFIERMKADILRRAEEISDDEEEEAESNLDGAKPKARVIAFDDDDDVGRVGNLKVGGDGEDSDSDDEGEDGDGEGGARAPKPQDPETILELAYIRDPKLFSRDAQTKRSKARSDLKVQTGWDDEQIEGWKIMLERNPRKDKILEKHEFAGNHNQAGVGSSIVPPGAGQGRGGGQARGNNRGGRGGGSGRGRDGGAGTGDANGARERAWKDKNKASRGNHNRKRGHDKKMARAGAGAGPST